MTLSTVNSRSLLELFIRSSTGGVWYSNVVAQLSCAHITLLIFLSPALAGKTRRDHFVPCCCLLSVVKRVNIWLYLPHALMDFNQSWVIDATSEPSFVDEVKGHISRSKVI